MKKAIINKNKDWVEINKSTRDSQKEKTEKRKKEKSQNKIQKESRAKENIIKQKKEQYKQEEIQNKENTEKDGDKDINRNNENRQPSELQQEEKEKIRSQPFGSVWLNGWVFVYELSGSGFESLCCYLNCRYDTCFEQGVPWHSGHL